MKLTLDDKEHKLLLEAMDKLTRAVSGDLAREKKPTADTKNRLQSVLDLAEKVRTGEEK